MAYTYSQSYNFGSENGNILVKVFANGTLLNTFTTHASGTDAVSLTVSESTPTVLYFVKSSDSSRIATVVVDPREIASLNQSASTGGTSETSDQVVNILSNTNKILTRLGLTNDVFTLKIKTFASNGNVETNARIKLVNVASNQTVLNELTGPDGSIYTAISLGNYSLNIYVNDVLKMPEHLINISTDSKMSFVLFA